jgi:hypothetical protein
MRRKGLLILLILPIIVFYSCEKQPTEPEYKVYKIEYEVTGTINIVTITYVGQNDVEQGEYVLPWSYSCVKEKGDYVAVSVLIFNKEGEVTVTIYKDDKMWKTKTGEGPWTEVEVEGIL